MRLCGTFILGFIATGLVLAQDATDPVLAKITANLRSKDPTVRLKAIASLNALGPKAEPASKSLCDAILDPVPQVGLAALRALEVVRPDLYKPVSTLLLDKDRYARSGLNANQMRSVKEIGELGEKARPTVNIILAKLQQRIVEENTDRFSKYENYLEPDLSILFATLRSIKPQDKDVIGVAKTFAGDKNKDSASRLAAIRYLHDWATNDERRRRETLHGVVAGFADPVAVLPSLHLAAIRYARDSEGNELKRRREVLPLISAGLTNPACVVPCINLVAEYGALATPLVPTLRNLKLSATAAVREAATTAVNRIEK